jgi:hypothetical protein
MDQQNPQPVNSRSWWDYYFQGQCHRYGGSEQARYFREALLSQLLEHETPCLGFCPSILSTPRVETWNLCHNVAFKHSFRSSVRNGAIQA